MLWAACEAGNIFAWVTIVTAPLQCFAFFVDICVYAVYTEYTFSIYEIGHDRSKRGAIRDQSSR
jgi:hypothetical protein